MKVKLLKKLRKLAKEERMFGRKGDNYVVFEWNSADIRPFIHFRSNNKEEALAVLLAYRRNFILDELAKYRIYGIKHIDV